MHLETEDLAVERSRVVLIVHEDASKLDPHPRLQISQPLPRQTSRAQPRIYGGNQSCRTSTSPRRTSCCRPLKPGRSEERRVGKECRSRGVPAACKNKH